MRDDHPLRIGGFGTHACRGPNFAVQNSDCLIAVGTRLDSKSTGTPVEAFARCATKTVVDIDLHELARQKGINGVVMDAKDYLREQCVLAMRYICENKAPDYREWVDRIHDWKRRYPPQVPDIVDRLSNELNQGDIIVSDTGHALAWMMQGFRFKARQRFTHAFNNTPMGYGLPAAIGASYANPGKPVTLITGDGGLQLNIQEMATIARNNLPIRIILFNNHGHGMCRQTQEQWLGGKFPSTSYEGGLACPDFRRIADAYGVELEEIDIAFDEKLIPQVRFGKPNEDGDPPLDRDELAANMLIPLWDA
jgi:acetolactate synthase-1/2/3 large subunit